MQADKEREVPQAFQSYPQPESMYDPSHMDALEVGGRGGGGGASLQARQRAWRAAALATPRAVVCVCVFGTPVP